MDARGRADLLYLESRGVTPGAELSKQPFSFSNVRNSIYDALRED